MYSVSGRTEDAGAVAVGAAVMVVGVPDVLVALPGGADVVCAETAKSRESKTRGCMNGMIFQVCLLRSSTLTWGSLGFNVQRWGSVGGGRNRNTNDSTALFSFFRNPRSWHLGGSCSLGNNHDYERDHVIA